MTSSIAAMHVAKKRLGLDDDTYRAKLAVITGKTSAKEMTEEERQRVISTFRREGFAPVTGKSQRRKLAGKYAPKLQALWIAGYNLGIVENREDTALISFVKRQAGVDDVRFLHDAADARKAIEGLKNWIARTAGVAWTTNGYDWMASEGAKIAWAQWKLLTPGATLMVRKGFDEAVLTIVDNPLGWLASLQARDWQKVMNTLGERVRAAKKAGK